MSAACSFTRIRDTSVRCESRGLRNRSVHCNRSRIVRTRVRTAASASPAGETIPVSGRGTDRDTSSAFSPSTGGLDRATGSLCRCQVILRAECRGVVRCSSGRDSVRNRAIVIPPLPCVLNSGATALRRSCSNSVTRTGRPRKDMCRSINSAVNDKRATNWIRLNPHLNGWSCRRGRCYCWRRTRGWSRSWCWWLELVFRSMNLR